MFDAIFHPTDLSEASADAFALGLKLAALADAELLTVHVESGRPEWEAWPDAQTLLRKWGGPSADFGRDRVRSSFLQLDAQRPHQALLEQIERFRPDLLILRTRGRVGIERLFAANIAEPLIRAARVPALVLPDGSKSLFDAETGAFQVRRVLFPIAPKPHPARAQQMGLDLIAQMGATDAVVRELFVGPSIEAPFRETAPPLGISWEKETVRSADVVGTILEEAREFDADLMVMGSRGHDGAMDALFGSTTERVLRLAPCAVLVIPGR